jgi:hypothetical protein
MTPARTSIAVGYRDGSLLGLAPLVLAREAGYLAEAGLPELVLVATEDPVADLRAGTLDIAVMDAAEAAAAHAADPALRAIAGYRSYAAVDGAYRGEMLVARPGMVATEPSTVISFLEAYVRALQVLGDPATQPEAVATLGSSDLAAGADVTDWPEGVASFAPFDGGFGSADEEGGLGELAALLAGAGEDGPDLGALIDGQALAIAQSRLALAPNPEEPLAGPPVRTDIRVGRRDPGTRSPLDLASKAGHFEAAGFGSVELVDVDEPILGILTGELDFGVLDAAQAADAVAQGLPLRALAGHRNYAEDGIAYGGDVIVTSSDLLEADASTASSFLVAYVRGLRDLAETSDAGAYAPFDGGFGSAAEAGGLGELEALLADELGSGDMEALVARHPLRFAQAWWGLPANPVAPGSEVSE